MTPRSLLVDWVLPMAALTLLVVAASEFVLATRVIVGRSMTPGLIPGDRVVVDRWTYRHRRPRVGEVALLRGPDGTPMVKRVASLSGDGIWVEGDNEPVSRDSRHFGRISDRAVRGRVVWRYWPLRRAGRVR